MSRSSSLALIALVVGMSRAQAQCPTWTADTFRPPGTSGLVLSQVVFDDGSGPALYIGGGNVVDGVGLTGVSRWDGVSMQALHGTINPYSAYALCAFDEGNGPHLFAGGLFVQGANAFYAVCRWDGSDWTVLGGAADFNFSSLKVFDEDGPGPAAPELYAGGGFASIGSVAVSSIARWNGTAWSAVGAGSGLHDVNALATFDPDGAGPLATRLYAVGNAAPSGFSFQQLKAWDGTSWTSVNGTFDSKVLTLQEFDPDGAGPAPALLFAGGYFHVAAGASADGSAFWNGNSWTAIAFNGAEHEFYAFAVHDEDGAGPLPPTLFAGGELESATIENVARWTGSAWAAVSSGVGGEVHTLASFDDGAHGPKLVAGGNFSHAGTEAAQNIVQWDAQLWAPLIHGNGLHAANVTALSTFDDGTGRALYAGGVIDYAGPLPVANIARWDGTSWSAVGSGVDGGINAMQEFDDGFGAALYVGGEFTSAGGTLANNIARWNGTAWSAVGSGLAGGVEALAVFDAGSGPQLYAGGAFPGGFARWDGSSWSIVEGGAYDVHVLAVHDDGSGSGPALYMGGAFTIAGGVPANHIASWRPGHWSALGVGTTQDVDALASFDPGTGPILVVGGRFQWAGGGPPGHLSSWANGAWHPISGGVAGPVQFQPEVATLFVHDDGSGGGPALYVGGNFTAVGDVPTENLARWDGTSWTQPDHGVESEVRSMCAFDDGHGHGASLFVAGVVESAGLVVSSGLARLSGCGSIGAPVCAGDGSGAACPCGNQSAAGSNAGCLNSLGSGARLTATGFASLSADDVVLVGTQMPDTSALYLQGTTALGNQAGVAFGDGLRCAGGNVIRLGTHMNVQGSSRHPAPGAQLSVQGAVTSPGPRIYQVWYRNAAGFCTAETFNLSNGLRVLWVD